MSELETIEIAEDTAEAQEPQEAQALQETAEQQTPPEQMPELMSEQILEQTPEQVPEPPSAPSEPRTYFEGELLGLIGTRLLCLLLYPVLPVLLSVVSYVALNIEYSGATTTAYFILAVVGLFVVFSALPDYLMWRWETNHTIIKGERLLFKGTLPGIIWLKIEILFFTIITFGFYIFLMANVTKKNKYRYKNTVAAGSEKSLSAFTGSVFTIFGMTVFFGMLGSLCSALSSGVFLLYFVDPAWSALLGLFSSNYYFMDLESLAVRYMHLLPYAAVSLLIIYTVYLLLRYTYRYFVLKWEVSNVIIAGKKWSFKNDFLSYVLILLLNSALSMLTLGVYPLLGIDYYLITKFKVKNIV